ncbi:hypothetical protein CPB85DRAFT_1439567 [Mucidula mucida]|nr:hypothetical protein CPB85DRAFT_1439567 [Mucidula mucida]
MPITRPHRRIPRTTLVAGYCFNVAVVAWAQHVLGEPYGHDLDSVSDAMFDMSQFTKSMYGIFLHPLGEELTVEGLENMIATRRFDFPKYYLGYPQERLPEIAE